MTPMHADDFAALLRYLEFDDEQAAIAFGMRPVEIRLMRSGNLPVPFLVSALTVLMCESAKAAQLAIEHGHVMRRGDRSLKDLLIEATGVSLKAHAPAAKKPKLRVIKDGE